MYHICETCGAEASYTLTPSDLMREVSGVVHVCSEHVENYI